MKRSIAFWVVAWMTFGIFMARALDVSTNPVPTGSGVPGTIYPLQGTGVTNFYQVTQKIYSGSAPEGEEGFKELKQLGIKTIITVDGAKPDVETAKRYGMRYIHLPFGYDGVPTNQELRLVRAAQTLPGPIFVHCHHGQHRGPTGVAIICMATDGWTPAQATAWLKLAGTSHDYPGLYRSVAEFKVPSASTMTNISDYFISEAAPSPLRDIMVEIDQHMSNLKLIKKANYTTPEKTNFNPEHESLLLSELFAELERSDGITNRSEDFLHYLHKEKTFTSSLHNLLVADPQDTGARTTLVGLRDDVFEEVVESCTDCHKACRN